MKSYFRKHYFLFSFLFLFLLLPLTSQASGLDSFKIDYQDKAFTSPASLKVEVNRNKFSLPWNLDALTPVYDYAFSTKGFYDPSYPLKVRIYYQKNNSYFKQVYAYDFLGKNWWPLKTEDHPREKYVSITIHSTSGRLIVLANPNLMTFGTASWYKFKGGLFAASPDFAKGSVLRVYNLANNKHVDVTINDWGPERDKFPKRVIDLDKVAFSKIASPRAGLVSVKVEPLKIVLSAVKKELAQTPDKIDLSASAAIIMLEKNAQVLWSKNINKVSPIASLTKLVAAKIFLDTKPSLNKIVKYRYADEKYNNRYVAPWQSARLRVKDGETMSEKDLLYSALVSSANNAVESLVRVSGLSRDKFISLMNQKVAEWGATNTHFIEPTGLSPKNVSSPLNYAIITREVFKNPLLKKITTTKRYSFRTRNTKRWHTLRNTDHLLGNKEYNIIGSKTGYLDEAGHCLMTRVATKKGNIIVINFASTSKNNNFLDNEKMIRYAQRLLEK